ncbi:ferric reductase [Ruegeria sediminis]|uniref:Ferric reductase n=1 Tax=Ruegeria sediminis TaxID=2583820 RepID=A0ABY2X032_9RHOB|nr:ferric reductase-like transmembrane domain-containing protein [Ruegeria sediminis]TMV08589.1 ferric reductase [Ruegeria sediminis]
MTLLRAALIWSALAIAVVVPLAAALNSPLLAWRQPVYIAAGLAGVVAMALLLVQPLLAGNYLPGLSLARSRRVHRWTGGFLVAAIVAHVAGLWVTSPPDVVDALLFASPTPFSAWGVISMWAVFAAALMAALRKRMRLRPRTWRLGHTTLVTIAAVSSIVHAMLIEGTMEVVSKLGLCALVLATLVKAVIDRRVWKTRR